MNPEQILIFVTSFEDFIAGVTHVFLVYISILSVFAFPVILVTQKIEFAVVGLVKTIFTRLLFSLFCCQLEKICPHDSTCPVP